MTALNENNSDFITLSIFFSLHFFKMLIIAFELSTFCIVIETDRLLLPNFCVTFIVNQCLYYITVNNILL